MKRRECLAAAVILSLPRRVIAQRRERTIRIGLLIAAGPAEASSYLASFKDELRKLGWIDGKNIVFEFRSGLGDVKQLPELMKQLIQLQIDLFVVSTTAGALAAKAATADIPIVFGMVSDPVASGVVASLARPGRNVTGWSNMLPETSTKLLELLKEAAPKASRIAVLFDPANPGKILETKVLKTEALRMGVTVHLEEVRTPDHIKRAFATIRNQRLDGLVTLHDTITSANRTMIVGLAADASIPSIFQVAEYVDLGGLMSYGLNMVNQWRRSAYYVDRILRGTKPMDLPVEQPTTFELVVNLRTAKALGITMPPTVLVRANRVIE